MSKKNEIQKYINSGEMQHRLTSLFAGREEQANKFKATIINIALDPMLANCTSESILKSALEIAEVGLPLSKGLGQAYIVKYSRDAQPVIGYKGWLALADRAGKSVKAKPVFKCDEFRMEDNGFDETITFKPNFDEREDYNPKWVEANLKGVLVAIRDNQNGIVGNTYVSFGKIKQLAGKSPARNSKYSPYVDWNLEMYMAKAIKYVISKTPINEAIAKAVEIDNRQDIINLEEKRHAQKPNIDLPFAKKEVEEAVDDVIPVDIEAEEGA